MQARMYFKSDEQEREETRKQTGEFGPRLEWSELELGMVLSAFNYGQVRTTSKRNYIEKCRGDYYTDLRHLRMLMLISIVPYPSDRSAR